MKRFRTKVNNFMCTNYPTIQRINAYNIIKAVIEKKNCFVSSREHLTKEIRLTFYFILNGSISVVRTLLSKCVITNICFASFANVRTSPQFPRTLCQNRGRTLPLRFYLYLNLYLWCKIHSRLAPNILQYYENYVNFIEVKYKI